MDYRDKFISIDSVLVGIKTFKECYKEYEDEVTLPFIKFAYNTLDMVESFVKGVPPIDAVKVVRCKDCEHSRKWGNDGTLLCYRDETTIHIVKPNAYCDGSQRRYAADDPEVSEFEHVVHGRWIEDYVYAEDPHDRLCYKCSVCGRTEEYRKPYCNCGAKMDGGKNGKL